MLLRFWFHVGRLFPCLFLRLHMCYGIAQRGATGILRVRFSRIYERVFSDHRRGLRSRGPGHVLPSDSPSSRKLTAALGVLLPAGQAGKQIQCAKLPHSIHMGTHRLVRHNFSLTTSLHNFTPRRTAVDSGLSPQYARNGRHGDRLPTILANRKL